jgi:hypothetical protein
VALVACPDCLRQISDAATACLECGRPTPDALPKIRDKSWYDAISYQIEREDGLVNQRLTWLMQFEGFMFAALGLISKISDDGRYIVQTIMTGLPVVGILAAISASFAIGDARNAAKILKKSYEEQATVESCKWPKPFGGESGYSAMSFVRDYSRALPLLVIGAWIYVLYRYVYHAVRFG